MHLLHTFFLLPVHFEVLHKRHLCRKGLLEVCNCLVHCSTAVKKRPGCPKIQDVVESIEGLLRPPFDLEGLPLNLPLSLSLLRT
jgi:hypothetical protein